MPGYLARFLLWEWDGLGQGRELCQAAASLTSAGVDMDRDLDNGDAAVREGYVLIHVRDVRGSLGPLQPVVGHCARRGSGRMAARAGRCWKKWDYGCPSDGRRGRGHSSNGRRGRRYSSRGTEGRRGRGHSSRGTEGRRAEERGERCGRWLTRAGACSPPPLLAPIFSGLFSANLYTPFF